MPGLLILCEYPTLLGGERSMLATQDAVATAGFQVHVAAPPVGPLADELRTRGLTHVTWQTHDARGRRFPLEQLRSDLSALITRVKPDLVHANSLSTARISGPVAATLRVASVGHLRDIVKLPPQQMADVNAHGRLLAVSRATRDFHVAQQLDAGRCSVLYNGVDLERFYPRPPDGGLHRELGLPSRARLVAVVGQIALRKGTDVALSAAWQLAADLEDVHWLVVGERTSTKPESAEFERLAREIAGEPPLAGRVHFLGARSDVADILPECALLVHAARQEPLGRVLLESAACGLAIVATDVGGTREIFPDDGHAALLVRPDDRSGLAAAVLSLLRDDARRRSLGQSARRRMEKAFDIRIAAARLIEHYQLALHGAG